MNTFKPGDHVVRTGENFYEVGKGERHIVRSVWPGGIRLDGLAGSYAADEFLLISRAPEPAPEPEPEFDSVSKPKHYNSDPSGAQCIQITVHRNFAIGNAIKYLWRLGLKDDAALEPLDKQIEDLGKAKAYIDFEIQRLRGEL